MAPDRSSQQDGSARRSLLRSAVGLIAPVAFISGALLLQMAPDLLDSFPRSVVWGLSAAGAVATAAVTVFLEPWLSGRRRRPAAPPRQPQVELPPYSEGFTGHTALMNRLRRRFRVYPRTGMRRFLGLPALQRGGHRRSPLVLVVDGAPGAGKTQVVTQIAHEVLDRFPDGVRWVELSGDRDPDESDQSAAPADTGRLGRGLGLRVRRIFDRGARRAPDGGPGDVPEPTLPQRAPRSPEKVLELLVHSMQGRIPSGATPAELSTTWRSLTNRKRMLFVLDNAKDAAQVEPLLPNGPRCAVLITSRRTFGDATFDYESHALGELNQREGEELLDRLAPPDRRGSPAERDRRRRDRAEIVRRCRGLPLAIRLCGGRLAERSDRSPREVLADLDDISRSPLLRGPNGFAASFAFSLQLCAPQGRLLLKRIADSDLHKFSDWSAAVLLDVPRDAARALIDELVRRFLVLPTERNETGEHTFRIHDLVRETLRLIDAREFDLTQWERDHWDGSADADVARRLVSAYAWLVEQAAAEVTRTHDPRVLSASTDLTPAPELRLVPAGHPRQWLAQERESLLMCLRLAEEHDLPELGWRLAHAFAALCQTWRVFWADWEQATLVELRMAYALGDRLAGGLARLDRAEIAGKMGDYAAGVEDAETAQRVFEQTGTPDPHWRARAWRSLGVNLQRRGHLDGGADALNEAERIFAAQGDQWWRARVLRDLAEVHTQRGRRRSAVHRPLRSREGDQHRRAQSLLRLACMIFRYEGDWEEYSNARIALAEVLAARGRELNAWLMLDEVRAYFASTEERWYIARCQRAMAELDSERLDRQYDACDLALNPGRAEERRDFIEGHVARESRRLKPESEREHQRIGARFARELREPAQRYLGEYFESQQRWFTGLPRSGREGQRAVAEQRRRWSVQRRIELLDEAVRALRGMGDLWGVHRTRLALGRVRLRVGGDVDESAAIMREAAGGFGDLGDQLWHARTHRAAAEALSAGGYPRHALADAERAYQAFQRLGDHVGRIGAQELFGRLLDETGSTAEAVRHLTAARESAREEGLEWRGRDAHRRLNRILGGPAPTGEGRGDAGHPSGAVPPDGDLAAGQGAARTADEGVDGDGDSEDGRSDREDPPRAGTGPGAAVEPGSAHLPRSARGGEPQDLATAPGDRGGRAPGAGNGTRAAARCDTDPGAEDSRPE
ncbi:NB-ARC domain-containing protein [Streptomonospora litoralis]|uniref:Regulatory protein AfsR n=1 Tax=Streptomonospora litoralis TaxID=2498135 RepID=A0A4P6PXK9_9ACTN|nr:NB-ARC domain-containing protein [Streptomonospora litoralis]QBI52996.1 Regulatory protein AfsR [Streptomonospora litoralis]